MTRARRLARPAVLWALVPGLGAAAFLTASSLSGDRVLAACDPEFVKVNTDGFSNPDNAYTWALSTFIDKTDDRTYLYGSTANFVDGAEIWRYDGAAWRRLVDGGFGNLNNTGIRVLQKFKQHLYAGTVNQAEGAQIWRSFDGTSWQKVVTGGFGDPKNISIRGMHPFQQYLYAGVQTMQDTPEPGSGQLWRSADGVSWEPVSLDGFGDPSNLMVSTFEVTDSYLYAGTKNLGGAQMWRSADGLTFTQVVGPQAITPPGFGIPGTGMIMHLKVFRNQLYVGTGNFSGFNLHRTRDGINYEEIGRHGMGDPRNILAWRFHVYEDALWLGMLNYRLGGRVWRSFDGVAWEEMVGPRGIEPAGFGEVIDWGVRSFATYKDKLYMGTAQCILDACQGRSAGTEVWEWSGESCS